jgi:hypothetical protein
MFRAFVGATRRRRALAAALSAGAGMLATLPGTAVGEPVFSVHGAPGPGPSRYDRVLVQRFGPASARTVLVLTPGSTSGAGVFTFVARDLVRAVPDLQVWAVDRREQAFEDTAVMTAGDGAQALRYYIERQPVAGRTFSPPPVPEVRFMGGWGLKLLVGDLHRVVARARRGGRRVVLGGHSLGASVAEAYAVWDFEGRAGARGLAGLVLIDGGLLAGPAAPTIAQARAELADIRTTGPREDIFRQATPWAYGVLSGVLGLLGRDAPDAASPLETEPLVPSIMRPPVRSTNAAWIGHAEQVLYPPTGAARAHAGHLAESGDPRGWIDGDRTPVARLAAWLAQSPINTVDWYTPRRLLLDVRAARPLASTRLTRLLGLRLRHRDTLTLPTYAFQTSSFPFVLAGARRLRHASRISTPRLVQDPTMLHGDPLTATPERNTFLETVSPFLTRIARQR